MATLTTHPSSGKDREAALDHLSFNAISLFQSCPLRFFFHYILDLPEVTVSASLVLGASLHQAIQYHFEQLLAGQPQPDLDTLLAVFQDHWQTYEPETIQYGKTETRDTLGRLADRMLRTFLRSDFAQPRGTILGVEEELRAAIIPGCPDLLARVDLLIETEDALQVLDFKTARSAWSADKVEEAAPQLLLYSELVKTLVEGKPLRLAFAVLTKTQSPVLTVHDVPIDSQQFERTKRTVERVWQVIQNQKFYPSPSPLQCPTCPYREPCRSWTG
jgi:putative RecB family exonuclease